MAGNGNYPNRLEIVDLGCDIRCARKNERGEKRESAKRRGGHAAMREEGGIGGVALPIDPRYVVYNPLSVIRAIFSILTF